jgi:hypothetical protein
MLSVLRAADLQADRQFGALGASEVLDDLLESCLRSRAHVNRPGEPVVFGSGPDCHEYTITSAAVPGSALGRDPPDADDAEPSG